MVFSVTAVSSCEISVGYSVRYFTVRDYSLLMSSKQLKDVIFAQRAGAANAINKNHTHLADAHGIRQNGSNHSKITRQSNPGRSNVAKGK